MVAEREKAKIISIRKTPLARQSEEGILIEGYKGDMIINRKGEWGNNLPPSLVLGDNGGAKRGREAPSGDSARAPKRTKYAPETGEDVPDADRNIQEVVTPEVSPETEAVDQQEDVTGRPQIQNQGDRIPGETTEVSPEVRTETQHEDAAEAPAGGVQGEMTPSETQRHTQRCNKRQLNLKQMLQALGQKGRKRQDEALETETGEGSRPSQSLLIDRDNFRSTIGADGELGDQDLVKITHSEGQLSMKSIKLRGKVQQKGRTRAYIKANNTTHFRENSLNNTRDDHKIGENGSEEGRGSPGSKARPEIPGSRHQYRKC